jgi:hypothetical protein
MSDPLIWYFAYGVNMNPQILESRKVIPKCSFVARVPKMRLAFEMISLYRPGTGDATIRPLHCYEQVPEIWGVLHQIPLSILDEQLDYWEAVDRGHYRRKEVEAFLVDDWIIQAITYEALNLNEKLKPSQQYLATILAGAEAFRLPEHYLQFLRNYPCLSPQPVVKHSTRNNSVKTF